MSTKTVPLSDELHSYLLAHSTPPDPVVTDLIEETRTLHPDRVGLQIAPEQALFLTMLTRLLGVRRAVEVGTFTGLSSLSIALGMPPDGRLICFDVSEEYTATARRYWRRAGVADRVELRIGDAREQLRTLPSEPHLDLVFIDADKTGYPTYWSELVPRVRSGGVILVDNIFQHGRVVDPAADDESVTAIRDFNRSVLADDRVELVILPLADGLTVARRR
ncbi:MAG TPA: O-methyltransferase [Natronosporangium sp.]|nr:O-methyltransferase [Natronosporangium sp.]